MEYKEYDDRRDRYSRSSQDSPSAARSELQSGVDPSTGRRVYGQRGTITSRPSRESIMQSYAAQDQARARSARLRNQESYKDYQIAAERNRERLDRKRELELRIREEEKLKFEERRRQLEMDQARLRSKTAQEQRLGGASSPRRVVEPLSSQESHERYERSRASYERERETRDALSSDRVFRNSNRDIIDGRGSIDSRAFNEKHDLVSYSIDENDKPDPMIDASNPKSTWRSHSGNDVTRHGVFARGGSKVPSFSSSLDQSRSYGSSPFSDVPPFIKIVVPLIAVLLIVLLVIVFF